jgi:hypothetical protein
MVAVMEKPQLRTVAWGLVLLLVAACGEPTAADAGVTDAGDGTDIVDAGTSDGGTGTADGGASIACASLPNTVYLQIGDTQEPLIKALGKALRNSTANPMTIVYVTSGSCTNISAFYGGTKIAVNPKYIPSAAENPTWTAKSASPTCTIEAGGHAVDLANSALFVNTCDPSTPPAGIKLFQGPIQAYTLVVPEASTQTAITAEEAYFVFGFGNGDQLTPWNDERFLFIRPATKSTLLTWASLLGVPAAKWKGVRHDASSQVLNSVSTSTSPEKTLGLLGVEIYDTSRATVNALAFRTWGQSLAYYPDSAPSAFDRMNVRDGHYVSWSPTVWLAKVDQAGVPTDARVKYLVDALLGNPDISPAPDFKPLDLVIAAGLVPDCAMKVTRSYEAGPLSQYTPSSSCGCYFESKVGGTSPECADGGVPGLPTDAGTCFAGTLTQSQIMNQCTTAIGVARTPVLPLILADGGLPQLP